MIGWHASAILRDRSSPEGVIERGAPRAPFGESPPPGPHRSDYRIYGLAGAVLVIALATMRNLRNHVALSAASKEGV